jgi:hypothetical protein
MIGFKSLLFRFFQRGMRWSGSKYTISRVDERGWAQPARIIKAVKRNDEFLPLKKGGQEGFSSLQEAIRTAAKQIPLIHPF